MSSTLQLKSNHNDPAGGTDIKTDMCPAKCASSPPPLPKAFNNIPLSSLGCMNIESKTTLETFPGRTK